MTQKISGHVACWRVTCSVPLVGPSDVTDIAQLIASDPALAAVVAVIDRHTADAPLGEYASVCQYALASGSYIPQTGAHPTVGSAGARSVGRAVHVTTFLIKSSFDQTRLETFLNDLYDVHPFEHPILELTETVLWLPSLARQRPKGTARTTDDR